MPEKWTEIDGGEGERAKGEERGIAGIPARTGHTQETGNRNSPTLRERGGVGDPPNLADTGGSWGSAKLGGYGREVT